MTLTDCKNYASAIISADRLADAVDTSSPYSDVFQRKRYGTNGEMLVCTQGFNERYQKRGSEGGRYPILADLKNIFHIGLDHGKRKAMGSKTSGNYLIGGYPIGAVVWADDGNRFISLRDNNEEKLPAAGKETKWWASYQARPTFRSIPNGQIKNAPTMNPIQLKLDAQLPTTPVSEKIMVRQFTGRDIGVSGCMVFSSSYSTNWVISHVVHGDVFSRDDYPDIEDSSFSMKLSVYPDIYENEEHKDSYIEVMSKSKHQRFTRFDTLKWEYRSPHKLIPIFAETTYYLYFEYENAHASDTFDLIPEYNTTVYLQCYGFNRVLTWPGSA